MTSYSDLYRAEFVASKLEESQLPYQGTLHTANTTMAQQSTERMNHSIGRRLVWPRLRLDRRVIALGCLVLMAVSVAIIPAAIPALVTQWVMMVLLILQAAFDPDDRVRSFCLTLSLFPITHLVSAGLPNGSISPLIEEIIIQSARLVSAMLVVRYLGLNREQLGLARDKALFISAPLAALAGVLLGLTANSLLRPQLAIDLQVLSAAEISATIGIGLVVAFVEVLVLCGLLLRATRPMLGDVAAMLCAALLFGLMRYSIFPLPYAALTVVEGVWLAWLTMRTRSIIPAMLAHGLMLIAFYTSAAFTGF